MVPAAFLAALEAKLGRPLADYFDLITGSSTGGIIALGLAAGIPAATILNLYERDGPLIFGATASLFERLSRTPRWLFQPKHDNSVLRAALQNAFGDRRIGEARTRIVVPAWDPARRSVHLYKTAHHEKLRNDFQCLMVDAAMATSAAPLYLPQHQTPTGAGLLDGGVWANNPIAIGVVEAVGMLKWDPALVRVLSIGCLDEVNAFPRSPGLGAIGGPLISLLMEGQNKSAIGLAKVLLNDEPPERSIHRIDCVVARGSYGFDQAQMIPTLKGIGIALERENFGRLLPVFFAEPTTAFVPIHQLGDAR